MRQTIGIAVIISIFLQLGSCSQQIQNHKKASSNQISIGIKDSLYSENLTEQREIWVHIPESSSDKMRFPVLYLLDGEFHFESMVGVMKHNVLNNLIPEMIVVAIPNTNRFRDLTHIHIGDETNPSGGGGDFLQFIEDELMPYIDNKYPTAPHRTFVGHSLGGLIVVNTLMKHPHLFNNYLAIDPSLSWGNQDLMNEARSTIKETEFDNKSLYIGIANTLRGEMTFEKALQDTTTATLHLRAILEFSKLAKSNDHLISDWKYYPDETHGTLPLVAEHDALRFLFSWYEFQHWGEFYSPEPKLTGSELVDLMVAHSEKKSKILGHQFHPDEDEVNRIAYMFLGRNDFERALPFFELNIQNYPESANAYDSMGDYYAGVSDDANAIKYYSKSLKLGEIEGTKEKLEELRRKEKD